jgi:excisionase family DNA binding protein
MRNFNLHEGAINMSTTRDEFFSRRDLMQIFKVSEPTIIRWEQAGKLPALRLGSRVRYRRVDVEAFITTAQGAAQAQ